MRYLAVLPFLILAGCATDVSNANDQQICRERGISEGTARYQNFVRQVSHERLLRWDIAGRRPGMCPEHFSGQIERHNVTFRLFYKGSRLIIVNDNRLQ